MCAFIPHPWIAFLTICLEPTFDPNVKADLAGKTWPTARMALPKLYKEQGLGGLYKVRRCCGHLPQSDPHFPIAFIYVIFFIVRFCNVFGYEKGGIPRTIRMCGAFFIVSLLRERCTDYKTQMQGEE